MDPRAETRAWVRLPSGRRLDLLAPTPLDWTDEDLAIGLSRTFRWGGHSTWPGAPLSVAQHSLAVLALRRAKAKGGLTEAEARRARRFEAMGHTPGEIDVEGLEAELARRAAKGTDYPLTLDLRRRLPSSWGR